MKKIKINSNFFISTDELFFLWDADLKLNKEYKRFVKSGVLINRGCYLIKRLFNKSYFLWGDFKSKGSIEYFVNEIYIDKARNEAVIDFIKISKKIYSKIGGGAKIDGVVVFVLLIQQDYSLLKFYVQRKDEPLVMLENLSNYHSEKLIRLEVEAI
jgi:hypothetical protein